MIDNNFPVRNIEKNMEDLADHGKIFHISEIKEKCKKYYYINNIKFEVQIWDSKILESIKEKVMNNEIVINK